MTPGEILVIAAAAAVFIIINILMWSIIIRNEQAEAKKKAPKPAPAPVQQAAPVPDRIIKLPDSVPASAAEMGFKLLDSTVIVHTDERI